MFHEISLIHENENFNDSSIRQLPEGSFPKISRSWLSLDLDHPDILGEENDQLEKENQNSFGSLRFYWIKFILIVMNLQKSFSKSTSLSKQNLDSNNINRKRKALGFDIFNFRLLMGFL